MLNNLSSDRPFLQVQNLSKSYVANAEPVFDEVNFNVAKGEFVCIIGHSGCGKTTILNVLAGLEQGSGGQVFMDGREVNAPGLERGVVFQGHALMPWLTVHQILLSRCVPSGPIGLLPKWMPMCKSMWHWWD